MSENTRMTKAAGVIGGATLISRILGYIRDMVIAGFFGAGLYSDAFIAAFRIPNLFRRLFAEGSLSIAFIPVFTEYLTKKGRNEAFQLAASAIRFLSILLTITAIAGVFLSPLIVHGIAYGFTDSVEKYSLTVLLTRIMFPYVILICLVALCMGILNTLGHFAAPAVAPILLNVVMIGAVYFASLVTSDEKIRVIWLACGVLLGGVLQLALQVPFLIRKGLNFWQKTSIFHPGLKKIGRLMLPALFGSGVYQVSAIVMTLLASLLPDGSVTYLYFSDRLVQFPLGIFAISIGTAILPSLSRQAAVNDFGAVKQTFSYALKVIFFIMLPSMVGLIVLRVPIVSLLFERSAFDNEATTMTATALLYFSMGLWSIAAVRIIVPTFYALQDTKTPVKMAFISIVANILLGVLLMRPLGHGGLALATSLASVLHFFLLLWALKIKLGSLDLKNIFNSVCKSVVCSAIMGLMVWGVARYIIPSENKTFLTLLLGIAGSITVGIFTYGLLSLLFKIPEVEYLMAILGKGRSKK